VNSIKYDRNSRFDSLPADADDLLMQSDEIKQEFIKLIREKQRFNIDIHNKVSQIPGAAYFQQK